MKTVVSLDLLIANKANGLSLSIIYVENEAYYFHLFANICIPLLIFFRTKFNLYKVTIYYSVSP